MLVIIARKEYRKVFFWDADAADAADLNWFVEMRFWDLRFLALEHEVTKLELLIIM